MLIHDDGSGDFPLPPATSFAHFFKTNICGVISQSLEITPPEPAFNAQWGGASTTVRDAEIAAPRTTIRANDPRLLGASPPAPLNRHAQTMREQDHERPSLVLTMASTTSRRDSGSRSHLATISRRSGGSVHSGVHPLANPLILLAGAVGSSPSASTISKQPQIPGTARGRTVAGFSFGRDGAWNHAPRAP